MNTFPPSSQRPEVAAAVGVDIDARIHEVEARLTAREARLHRHKAALGHQVRAALQPRRFLVPAGGALLTAMALRALWHKQPPPAPAGAPAGSRNRRVPWRQLVTLAWPLLPIRWRDRVGPGDVASLTKLALPVFEQLVGHRREAPLPAVAQADLKRLRGRWFLIAELPEPFLPEALEPPELGLLPRDDGQYDLLERRVDATGTHGRQTLVKAVPGSDGARLKFSTWPHVLQGLPWAWTEHRVLHVDEAYDEALIGSPARDSLWLLSRRPQLAPERREALLQIARERGFAVEHLRFTAAG